MVGQRIVSLPRPRLYFDHIVVHRLTLHPCLIRYHRLVCTVTLLRRFRTRVATLPGSQNEFPTSTAYEYFDEAER